MSMPLIFKEKQLLSQWVPSESHGAFEKKHCVIALDWDDTLLCTSWLIGLGCADLDIVPSEKVLASCALLANSVAALIIEAQKYGDVIIVTNADEGWVQGTCSVLMPTVWPLIISLKIFSAQHLHSDKTPSTHLWKKFVFRDYIWSVYGYDFKHSVNFVSIGDGLCEEYAVHALNGIVICGHITGKSLRFMEKSNPETLIQQLCKATESIRHIVMCKQSLCLTMNISHVMAPKTCHEFVNNGNIISRDTSVDCD
jgi:hypothetical protein